MVQIHLLLLPYAGGSASVFHFWKERLPRWINPIPLHLPGRGVKSDQQSLHEWPALIDRLLCDCHAHIRDPFAIFGHSLGALIGLELAHAIRSRYHKEAAWFGASGCKAPIHQEPDLKWLDCPEEDLVSELQSLNGTPPELLQNRELMTLLLPTLRADFHLRGTYTKRSREPLNSPMLVLGGDQDEISVPSDNLSDWYLETSHSCKLRWISGDHFFINQQRDKVIDMVVETLSETRREITNR